MRIVLWTWAFTLILFGFDEALNVTAGYKTRKKDDDGKYLAIVGEPLTIWVRFDIPKKDVLTIKMTKPQKTEFHKEFHYEGADPPGYYFSESLRDRAHYIFTYDGMEITITSLKMNDSGMYIIYVERSTDDGYATFDLKDIKPVRDEITTTTIYVSTSVISQGSSTNPGQVNPSSDDFHKIMIITIIAVAIVISIAIVSAVIIVIVKVQFSKESRRDHRSSNDDESKGISSIEMQTQTDGLDEQAENEGISSIEMQTQMDGLDEQAENEDNDNHTKSSIHHETTANEDDIRNMEQQQSLLRKDKDKHISKIYKSVYYDTVSNQADITNVERQQHLLQNDLHSTD